MALLEIEELLAPLSEDSPAGEDLDGTPARYAIEEAFQADQAEVAEGEEPAEIDWRGTVRRIIAQAGETRDLWLAAFLMRAGAKLGDLDTVTSGAQLLAGLLEQLWPVVHPQLEMVDFIGRKAPCEALTKHRDFLAPLRKVILLEHARLGRYSAEDFERFASEGDGAEGYGMFRAALEATPLEDLQSAVDRLDAIRDAIRRADVVLTANAEGDTATNFQPTYEAVEALRRVITPYAGMGESASAGDDGAEPGSSDSIDAYQGGPSGGFASGGRIASRDDVIKALDAIADYYQAREPSSPVPALLRRARSWVNLDFMAVLKDLAPDTLSDARKVLGIKDEEQDGY